MSLTALAAPAHADTSAGTKTATTGPLTAEQAVAKARIAKKPVVADAATTATDQLTANPDGTFTLDQSVTPVRRYQGGGWKSLDPTLVKRADGSIAPVVTSGDLTLSGGGTGPLAQMKGLGRSLSLTLPSSLTTGLPSPELDGPTATYHVLDGVDLKVTVDPQGGFSEVLIVKDATAAANPALKSLAFTTRTTGVDLATDAVGNLTAKDKSGRVVFSAPAPVRGVWDSALDASAPTVTDPATGATLDARTGEPAHSSAAAPGATAHTAPLKATYGDNTLTLVPDAGLLSGKNTVWPLYIDPPYSAGGSALGWTYVSSYYSDTSYWKTSDSEGLRVGYNNWESPNYVGRTFARMSVPSSIYGAQVISSRFYATETWSAACNQPRDVELWWTGAISSSTTWNNQPSWNGKSDTQHVAFGNTCSSGGVGFNTTGLMQNAANGSWGDVTLGLRASDESDGYGWKKFQPSSMTMTTTYNHAPAAPTLYTSPATSCPASTPTVIGDGDTSLRAWVSDPEGGSLTASFKLTKTATGTPVASSDVPAGSGSTATYVVTKDVLEKQANGAPTTFSWNVAVSDGSASTTSTTCSFTFDPTSPGAPTVTLPNLPQGASFTVGTPFQVSITANPTGAAPASYAYQVNEAAPVTVTASSGTTTVTITPTRAFNTLSVTALAASGNPSGNSDIKPFPASLPAPAAENDLTGQGHADLAVVGNTSGLPPGLWLASGTNSSNLNAASKDIGASGNGINSNGAPADWNGTQAVVGHFFTGTGFNDVLDYKPGTGTAQVLAGNGDGSTLQPFSATHVSVADTRFKLSTGAQAGVPATHVTSGGLLKRLANDPTDSAGFPDLLMTVGGQLVVEGAGLSPGTFERADDSTTLVATSPTGSNWDGWTITSAVVNKQPGMFARHDTGSGELYYYSPTLLNAYIMGDYSTAPVRVAPSGWDAATFPVIQAADVNHDGIPDLRAISSSGAVVNTYLFNGTSLVTPPPSQTLITATHAWALKDGTTGTATATDTTGNFTLTGSAGATWRTSDTLFNPDAYLDGSTTGSMTTPNAVDVANNFSVSVWARPEATGGVILSEDGSKSSGFLLFPDTANKAWYFCLAKSDTTSWSYDCASGGTITLGAWVRLTGTYDKTSNAMALYVNDNLVGTTTHTALPGFTGNFTVGNQLYGGTHQSYFKGSISDIQLWGGTALTPAQVAMQFSTAAYLQPTDRWHLGDTSDSARPANSLTLNGGATTSGDPVRGTALTLNGSTAYAATSGTTVDTKNSYTVSAWVYPTNFTSNSTYASQSGTKANGLQLYYSATAQAFAFGRANADDTTGTFEAAYGPTTGALKAQLNTWTHLTGVYDSTSQSLKLYINGTLASTTTYTGTAWTASSGFQIGRRLYQGNYGEYAAAKINDVQIFTTALSASNVAALTATG